MKTKQVELVLRIHSSQQAEYEAQSKAKKHTEEDWTEREPGWSPSSLLAVSKNQTPLDSNMVETGLHFRAHWQWLLQPCFLKLYSQAAVLSSSENPSQHCASKTFSLFRQPHPGVLWPVSTVHNDKKYSFCQRIEQTKLVGLNAAYRKGPEKLSEIFNCFWKCAFNTLRQKTVWWTIVLHIGMMSGTGFIKT